MNISMEIFYENVAFQIKGKLSSDKSTFENLKITRYILNFGVKFNNTRVYRVFFKKLLCSEFCDEY